MTPLTSVILKGYAMATWWGLGLAYTDFRFVS
jgi:hypothetical protein